MAKVIGKIPETDVAKSESVFVISNKSGDMSFEPPQSYAVAFCINRQTSPRFRHKQLGDTVVNDARKVLSALQVNGVVPRENAKLIEAKSDPNSCTFAGMKKAFKEHAKLVRKEGIFFFHFSGHGFKLRDDQFSLVPMDFDHSKQKHITASVLSEWMNEANCEAKCVVFIIDCSYAGALADALTFDFHNKLTPGKFHLYVMAACTAEEKSTAINTLQNTPYCYFLTHAIQTTEFSPGHFPIKRIHEKCEKLTTALTSLLLSYDKAHGLVSKKTHPAFQDLLGTEAGVHVGRLSKIAHPELSESKYYATHPVFQGTEAGVARVMGQLSLEGVRSEYILPLYEGDELPVLEQKCCDWLESTYKEPNGGLVQLQEEGLLDEQCVMDTVLCCMLHSLASIQLCCDSTIVASPNFYLTAYEHVVNVISDVCSGPKFDLKYFIWSMTFYHNYLKQQKLDTRPFLKLYEEANRLENPHGGFRADSGVPVSQFLLATV